MCVGVEILQITDTREFQNVHESFLLIPKLPKFHEKICFEKSENFSSR